MPVVEAMGHGVPVVAYGVTAVPETVGDAGILLDSKEPLRFAAAVAPGARRPRAASPRWRPRPGRGWPTSTSTRSRARFVELLAGPPAAA